MSEEKPCMWCGHPVQDQRGSECDGCWELRSRLEDTQKSVVFKMLMTIFAEKEVTA